MFIILHFGRCGIAHFAQCGGIRAMPCLCRPSDWRFSVRWSCTTVTCRLPSTSPSWAGCARATWTPRRPVRTGWSASSHSEGPSSTSSISRRWGHTPEPAPHWGLFRSPSFSCDIWQTKRGKPTRHFQHLSVHQFSILSAKTIESTLGKPKITSEWRYFQRIWHFMTWPPLPDMSSMTSFSDSMNSFTIGFRRTILYRFNVAHLPEGLWTVKSLSFDLTCDVIACTDIN